MDFILAPAYPEHQFVLPGPPTGFPRCGGARWHCNDTFPACRLVRSGLGSVSFGSIPACAGEPTVTSVRHSLSMVYPRVCGGTGWLWSMPVVRRGLSPRVRGNLPSTLERAEHDRSIPACAGEPAFLPPWVPLLRVYPRVCGGT